MKSLLLKIPAIFILFFLLSAQAMQGQALGTWKSYMAYQNATMVAVADNGCVYAVYKGYPYLNLGVTSVSDGSLMRYDPKYGESKKIFKANGLNDAYIVRIAYMESKKILVIVYDNGNIDLYDTSTDTGNNRADVYNIASFMNQTALPDKTVNDIVFDDSFAYICMNYGIIAIDVTTKTFKNTYNIGLKTYSMCIWGDYVYAATENGIKRAKKDGYLSSASSWESYPLSYNGNPSLISKILTYNNNFVFFQNGAGVFYQTEPFATPIALSGAPNNLNQVAIINNQLVLLDNSGIYFYSNLNSSYETRIDSNSSVYVSSINNSDIYWLAQGYQGISNVSKTTGTISSPIVLNSPKRNLIFNMKFDQGKLLLVGGGMSANNFNNSGTFMVLDDKDDWYNVDEVVVQQQIRTQTGVSSLVCRDFSDVAVDPRDNNHYFVTAFGEGLYEFKSNPETKKIDFEKLYTEKNTSGILKSVTSSTYNNKDQYIRLGGLAYDNNNNLYIISSNELDVERPIVIYTADGKWTNLGDPNLPKITLFKSLIVTGKNQKWTIATRAAWPGIYVFNDDEQIFYFSKTFTDQDNENLDITYFNCVTEDLNGTIWVGTSIGPIVFYNPEAITKPGSSGFNRCSRIKMPRNDGTDLADFLLDGVNITSIAVDGANRKWIGTTGSGVFLVSPTGEEVIANYNTDNSPLISNNIMGIAVNNANGEVFIGTDQGLVSYMSDATEGKPDYSNVYAYPNPVRPDFVGDVVVTGLIKDSNVKITDLSGNAIYQGTSVGGQFTWNCKNRAGERVKTGVYLVFAATADGTQGVVSKIVVIK